MDLLEQHRQEFPGLNNKVYFNFGGQGPLPRAALEAIIDTHQYLQNHGPFSTKVNLWLEQKKDLLRQTIATELGVVPETITLTENVTVSCNIPLWGIDWQGGDRILLTDCEHPGIIATVRAIARRFELEVATCPIRETLNQGDPVAVIDRALRDGDNTRILILSHVLWNTGQVLPLAEIVQLCHQKRVFVLVDAAQSVGCLPLNLSELQVDFYAFTGHKWWCGPAGVGGLYIRPAVFQELQPTFIGWRGIDTDPDGQPSQWKANGSRFEVATSAYPQYEGLRAAIAVHRQWATPEKRYEQIAQMSGYLWQLLSEIEGIQCLRQSPPESGLVSFQMRGERSPQKLVQELERQGFYLRSIADPACIRACVHYLTTSTEIEQLAAALRKMIY
jgi:L-cysteine/cystine lyase